jgi:hypothetical protein
MHLARTFFYMYVAQAAVGAVIGFAYPFVRLFNPF